MTSTVTQKQILTSNQTYQKIRRIAFEIFEQNFQEKEIILAGIVGEGYSFAKRLATELTDISPLEVVLVRLDFDKNIHYQSPILMDDTHLDFQNKVVVIVDDVLNTGRTLAFALDPFLRTEMKKVQVAVIVDRSHHLFPIHADYVGYSLSTTISEHVKVVLSDEENAGVYLK